MEHRVSMLQSERVKHRTIALMNSRKLESRSGMARDLWKWPSIISIERNSWEKASFEICAVARGNADLFGSLISPVNFSWANHSNGVCGVGQASHPLSITSMAELRVPDVRGNWTCTEHVWNSNGKFGKPFGIPSSNNRLLPTRSRARVSPHFPHQEHVFPVNSIELPSFHSRFL